MEKTLYLMQGVPGSGKSTLAKAIEDANYDVSVILSTDDHRIQDCGHYTYDPATNSEYHRMTQRDCIKAMQISTPVIIIDNTNIEQWQADPYITFARTYGYDVVVVRVDPGLRQAQKWNKNRPPGRAVPEAVVQDMYNRMETIRV